MSKFVPFITIIFCTTTFSQTTITGDISGMTFKPSGNPWIVKENVFIEDGSKTVIKPGCIFLFKPFTGIIVQGSLEVEGQPEMPVVFTSINDSLYNEASTRKPEPFDWNGITVEKTAENVKMTDFVLSYSVYGLKSKKDIILLERGIFRRNGQFNFTINEKMQEVETNVPFSYNTSENPPQTRPEALHILVKPGGIGSIITGTSLLGVMGYYLYSASKYNNDYRKSDNKDDIIKYTRKRDDAVQTTLITGIIGGILVPAGIGLLIWEQKPPKSQRNVSFYPVAGECNGFQFVVKF